MSLSKEVSHDLRMLSGQPTDLAVLPSWARIIPIAFYVGFTFFLLGWSYNTINSRLFTEKQRSLRGVVAQYEDLLSRDRETSSKLVEQRNSAVQVVRWVDYSPMLQKMLVEMFSSLGEKVEIGLLQIDRKQGIQPEYTLNLSFKTEPSDIGALVRRVRDALAERGWQLTTGNQVYQEGITNFLGYIQPVPSAMPFESQYLSVLQDPNRKQFVQPTGVSQ
jgi:hypothetical protein